jgi:MFS family permease
MYTPGYPLILAGIYGIFGTGRIAEAVTYTVSIVAASAVYALLPLLSIWLGLPRRVGLAAAIIGAIMPVYLLNEFRSGQYVFGALCLIGLTLLTVWVSKTQKMLTWRLGAIFGVAWGCALLVSPNLLLIGLLWLFAAALHYRANAIRFGLVALGVTLAILSPWAIRNAIVLGSPIFTRSNLGLELWMSNNDISAPSYGDNMASYTRYQPFMNPTEANLDRRMGELAFMHQRLEWSRQWIERHPRRFATLTANRILLFWLPFEYRVSQTIVVWGLTIGGLVGLAFAWTRHRAAFWILGAIWLGYPPVYYLVELTNPYRYPMYWSVLLLAVYGCMCSIDVLRMYALPFLQRPFGRVRPVSTSI